MIRHEFHPEALAKYEDAARQTDLGLRFIASVEDAVAGFCEAPDRGRTSMAEKSAAT